MNLYFNTNLDEKSNGGKLPPTRIKKSSVLYVTETGKGIPRRKLRGNKNQCPTCLEYFNSFTAFDRHRIGSFDNDSRRCLAVTEMQKRNFGKTEDGFWLCPVSSEDRERLNRIRTRKRKPSLATTAKSSHHG